MKKSSFNFLLTLLCLFFLSSCVADLFDKEELTPPVVSISKIENNDLNESIVYFSVREPENDEVNIVGTAMSTNGVPETRERQLLFQGLTGNLLLNLGELSSDSTYYIKAFAGNESGFAESDVYVYTPAKPIPIEAPCTLPTNQITDAGSPYNVNGANASKNTPKAKGDYGVIANYFSIGGRKDIRMAFQEKPTTGRYNTTNFDNFGSSSNDIYIDFYRSSGAFSTGKNIYIAVDSNDIATIEFCDLEYTIQSSTYNFQGSFDVKLND